MGGVLRVQGCDSEDESKSRVAEALQTLLLVTWAFGPCVRSRVDVGVGVVQAEIHRWNLTRFCDPATGKSIAPQKYHSSWP